ncbi:Release factor glutamine methyltransferase [uncultured Blautia sp.]
MKGETWEALLKEGQEILEAAGIEEAGLDAWLLLEYESGKNRAYYFAHCKEEADEEIKTSYMEKIRKRAQHIPLQHLTHQGYFMGYEFFVNENVLVPRQDTEVLVEEALSLIKEKEVPQILDMCTGSGCILLSLLLEREDALGTGADLSEKALSVAEKNRETYHLETRAELIKSDMFQSGYFEGKKESFDIIVSNPPYIPTEEIEKLQAEVRFHDPFMALDGKEDGLYFYRIIAKNAGEYLKPGGFLACEIGCDQGEDVKKMFESCGFSDVKVIKDLAGLDRVVSGKLPD